MSKSKLTLIVDGNWLLMSRLAIMNNRFGSDAELVKELNIMMMKSLNLVLRTFRFIDNIIFVADGGSWRNDVPIIDYLKKDGVEYKGNREKDPNTNWDVIFDGFKHLMEILSDCGVTVCRETGLEGDDWCTWWSHRLNADNTNVIIWSRDHDLTQLVSRNANGCFTVCWEKKSGLTTVEVPDDDMNFFFNPTYSENESIYYNVVQNSGTVNTINPTDIVIDKIVRGDAGDNILPIILRTGKVPSEKLWRVSTKELPRSDMDITDDQQIRSYIHSIMMSKQFRGHVNKSEEDIYQHFIYNRTLVWLSESNYPPEVLDTLGKYTEYSPSTNVGSVIERLEADRNDVTDVLDTI